MARVKWIPIAIFPILIITVPPHQIALGDPKRRNGYGPESN